MSETTYNEASEEDKQHFIECGQCGEHIDCRDLDEIFSHETDHKPHPDIPYSGEQENFGQPVNNIHTQETDQYEKSKSNTASTTE